MSDAQVNLPLEGEELAHPGEHEEDEADGENYGMVRPPTGTVTPIRDVPDLYVFRFELGPAILAQLLEKLREIPLTPILDALDAKYPGFYHIHFRGQPKYIGQSIRPIGARLREHVKKLSGRRGLSLDDVGVRYVYVEDPSLVSVSEATLINFFTEHGLAEWNHSGYGGKAPGYGRGRQKRSSWSEEFPPDLRIGVPAGSDKPITLYDLVYQVARSAPLTLSIPTAFRGRFKEDHPTPLEVPKNILPFEDWVECILQKLEPGWRIEREQQAWYIVGPPQGDEG